MGSLLPVPAALAPHRKLSRPGIQPIRAPLDANDLTEIHGLPVVTRIRGAFDHARLSTLVEAVVGLDAMVRRRLITVNGLRAYCEVRPGWKGIPVARRALELADGRSGVAAGKPPAHVLDARAGLPRLLVNRPIYHEEGYLLGIADLLDAEAWARGGVDGSEHRGRSTNADRHRAPQRVIAQQPGLTWISREITDTSLRDPHRQGPYRLRRFARLPPMPSPIKINSRHRQRLYSTCTPLRPQRQPVACHRLRSATRGLRGRRLWILDMGRC